MNESGDTKFPGEFVPSTVWEYLLCVLCNLMGPLGIYPPSFFIVSWQRRTHLGVIAAQLFCVKAVRSWRNCVQRGYLIFWWLFRTSACSVRFCKESVVQGDWVCTHNRRWPGIYYVSKQRAEDAFALRRQKKNKTWTLRTYVKIYSLNWSRDQSTLIGVRCTSSCNVDKL